MEKATYCGLEVHQLAADRAAELADPGAGGAGTDFVYCRMGAAFWKEKGQL